MQVIIPVAGKGTRLRPHTHLTPKPLIKVAGKEVLGHILDKILPLNPSEVIFIVGHKQEKVQEYVSSAYPDLKITSILQEELKGTADAIKLAEPYIKEDVLIDFVDTLFETDLSIIKDLPQDVDGLIWTKEVENYQRFGVILTDEAGMMKKIVEKPSEPISKLANIGLYYIRNWQLMFESINHVLSGPVHEKGEYFLTDAFQYMVDKGAKLKITEVGEWLDTGKIETVLETNRFLLQNGHGRKPETKPGVVIHDPVQIAADVVLENTEIGPNVTVESGCIIKDSKISNSIIGPGCELTDVQLKDSLVGAEAQIKNIKGSLSVLDHSTLIGHE